MQNAELYRQLGTERVTEAQKPHYKMRLQLQQARLSAEEREQYIDDPYSLAGVLKGVEVDQAEEATANYDHPAELQVQVIEAEDVPHEPLLKQSFDVMSNPAGLSVVTVGGETFELGARYSADPAYAALHMYVQGEHSSPAARALIWGVLGQLGLHVLDEMTRAGGDGPDPAVEVDISENTESQFHTYGRADFERLRASANQPDTKPKAV